MNRVQKTDFIESVRGALSETSFVILTDFKGSTVEELDVLRRACETAGATFRVVKNTLCRIAVSDTDLAPLTEHFSGNVGIVFAGEDPVAAAKVFEDQVKVNDKLVLRAGYFEGDVLDANGVSAVAALPSREELLSTLLATIQEGPRQVMGVLQAPARDILYLLNNYASELEQSEA
jgi:large subunit ribosomal protein L10